MEYGTWIKQAFAVAKKAKWLWVPAALMGTSSQISFRSFGRIFDKIPTQQQNTPDIIEKTSDVLGAATNPLLETFRTLSYSSIAFLITAIVVAAIFGFIVRLIIASWSTAAVFMGIREVLQGREVTLASSSAIARPKIKPLVLYGILLGILMMLCIGGIIGGTILLIGVLGSEMGAIKILLALPLIIFVVLSALGFAITLFVSTYAQRYILFFDLSIFRSLKMGIALLRKNIGPTVKVSLICIVSAIIGGIVTVPLTLLPTGILSWPLIVPLLQGNQPATVSIVVGIIGGAGGFIFGITLGLVVTSFVIVFQQTMWNLLFDHLTKETK